MDAKVCDRCGRVIKPQETSAVMDIGFGFADGGDLVQCENWDVCPTCIPIVEKYLNQRVLLLKDELSEVREAVDLEE